MVDQQIMQESCSQLGNLKKDQTWQEEGDRDAGRSLVGPCLRKGAREEKAGAKKGQGALVEPGSQGVCREAPGFKSMQIQRARLALS